MLHFRSPCISSRFSVYFPAAQKKQKKRKKKRLSRGCTLKDKTQFYTYEKVVLLCSNYRKDGYMNTIYEKNEKGYILRQRTVSATVVIICIICFGLILTLEVLAKWGADKPHPLNVWWIVGFFLAGFVVVTAVLRTECGYIVVSEEGIYFHRPIARTKFITWENVRDWGVAHQRTRYSRVYDLYFSTEVLKPTRHGKNKKIPMTYKNVIYITVEINDLSSLKRTGVIRFCRQHLSGDNTSKKKVIPMFISDLAEGYTF